MTSAFIEFTSSLSESLISDSQGTKELLATVESFEYRLAVLETDFSDLRATSRRTNELLEQIVSKLGDNSH
jgi:hypothetical protein